jgi:DNA-binding transcriptional LysR family regulator
MDRFDTMRVFARIVECRSFTQAAEDLGLPRSSATDAVKALEARLGVRLLLRTTRHVSPTLDGEAYYQRCIRLIADLEEADNSFASAQPQGLLHVGVQGTLASHFLLPHLPEFMALYPGIELQFSESDRYSDLVREGMDCVLRGGRLADSELVARRLASLEEVTCASPAYLARHGVPSSVDALEQQGHRMVGFRSSATGGVLPLVFLVEGRARELALPSALVVNGVETYAAASLAGLGLIQAPRYSREAELRSGALVELLPQVRPPPMPVSVLYPRSRHPSARLRVFIDWMAQAFAAGSAA